MDAPASAATACQQHRRIPDKNTRTRQVFHEAARTPCERMGMGAPASATRRPNTASPSSPTICLNASNAWPYRRYSGQATLCEKKPRIPLKLREAQRSRG